MLPFHSAPFLYQVQPNSYPSTKSVFKRNNNSAVKTGKTVRDSFSSSRDSEWLTLEICREFLRGTCPREELTCRYAHPSKNIYCNNSRVVCCYDYIKGRCHRFQPPCKYLHPPNHLKEQLLQNGKANLLMKNMQVGISTNNNIHAIQRTNSTGAHQLAPVSVSPRCYSQPQHNEAPSMGSLHSMTYIHPLQFYVLSSSDNPNLQNFIRANMVLDSPNPDQHQKSTATLNYPINGNQILNDSIFVNHIPVPPYFYGNTLGSGSQVFVKNWPLCTYPSMPY